MAPIMPAGRAMSKAWQSCTRATACVGVEPRVVGTGLQEMLHGRLLCSLPAAERGSACLLPSCLNFSRFYSKETGPRPNPLNSKINFQEIEVGSGWEAVCPTAPCSGASWGKHNSRRPMCCTLCPREAQGPPSTLNAAATGR